ncbi:sigma-70 family RNA polymerase sigma factor [Catenovulum sp. 2E275]|uniref:RNA polymerase sigma factor n=1 Tax=Catenovulum sp. 2E275 TaxID=2980497 RepID=UPI0021D202EA|nr:sigma-70 family RNA polymerase sigma factor [Catenovulum sp. 2E275]MCU4675179.1 sigma-70 family RNA polymerase sigma factor [Catenovulum sp. 2E275]
MNKLKSSFDNLVTTHSFEQQLTRYLNRHADNPDEAADIYQESVVRVLEQAKQTQINNPIAYVIQIAKSLLIKNKIGVFEVLEDTECSQPSPEDTLASEQKMKLIEQSLLQMPTLRREVFTLRRIQGESRQQIALKLNLSEAAVSKHLTRAMADIQSHIDTYL